LIAAIQNDMADEEKSMPATAAEYGLDVTMVYYIWL
jgi:hypothetical protein